ncbi:MAG: Gfo/Idh/MocA family protein [Phycisphaerales bacterium JB038]
MTKDDLTPVRRSQTRREFLKTSTVGLAALSGLSVARAAHVAGSETIRIGMIGCGDRCSGAAVQAMTAGPYVKLVAMYDVFEDRLQSHLETIRKARPDQVLVDADHCFTSFDGYKHVIESSDVVLIACASKFHPMYSEAAIRAGKHVFVEKPHGIDPVGVRRMQAACDLAAEKGLSIVSGLQSRFYQPYQEAVARIRDGAIGDITSVQSMFLRGPYRVYAREAGLSETQYHFRNWYHFRWLSGDDVAQSLVHNIDRVSWLLREEAPAKCFGLGGRSSSFGEIYGDMFDHHTAVYEYASGPRLYALCRTQNGCYNNSSDIIMGTKGTCHLSHRPRIDGENPWRFSGQGNNAYQAEQNALIESVRTGKPINGGSYMARSTLASVLGQVACYTGKLTTWEEIANSDLQFGPTPDESSFDTEPPTEPDDTGNYPIPMPGVSAFG